MSDLHTLILYENKGSAVDNMIKPIRESKNIPLEIYMSKRFRLLLILAFSSSIFCNVVFH